MKNGKKLLPLLCWIRKDGSFTLVSYARWQQFPVKASPSLWWQGCGFSLFFEASAGCPYIDETYPSAPYGVIEEEGAFGMSSPYCTKGKQRIPLYVIYKNDDRGNLLSVTYGMIAWSNLHKEYIRKWSLLSIRWSKVRTHFSHCMSPSKY